MALPSLPKVLSVVILCLLFTEVHAQAIAPDSFFSEPAAFYRQLRDYLSATKIRTVEEQVDALDRQYKSGRWSDEEILGLRAVCVRMLEFKLPPNPNYKNLVECAVVYKNNPELDAARFLTWTRILNQQFDNIDRKKLQPVNDFIDFSRDLFAGNSLREAPNSVRWRISSNDYAWKFENGEASITMSKPCRLIASYKTDSVVIQDTRGTYYPSSRRWVGQGGKVSWERYKLDPEVYGTLKNYEVDVTKSLYEADSVMLRCEQYFPGKLVIGKLEDKISVQNAAIEGSYPRFESYESILSITNLGEGLDYSGGFKLHGNTVYGTGSPALLRLRNPAGKTIYAGRSRQFVIRKGELIVGEQVKTSLYFGQDSITHPSINLRYEIPKRILSFTRGQKANDRNLFYDSYHHTTIDANKLVYYLNGDSMTIGEKIFGLGTADNIVNFESEQFYDENEFRRIQNISSTNPLVQIKKVGDEYGNVNVPAMAIAQRMNPTFEIENIQSLLYDLVAKGFLEYDPEKQVVNIKEKLGHYFKAGQKKSDYDTYRLDSESSGTNAVMNMKDYSVKVNGIRNVEFSRKKKVAMKPDASRVVLGKDRNLDFNGKLFSGYGVFHGNKFAFQYDKFFVKMDSIRFFDIYVQTGEVDKKGEPVSEAIQSRIENLSGNLLIDAPSNKSGLQDIAGFPSFQSTSPAYVFYDRKETQNGAYKRDSFFFQMDRFSFQGLNRFLGSDLNFKGKLQSARIFPDIKETLLLQDDKSLGFNTRTGEEGLPIFEKRGIYTGAISLSNRGLLGKGGLNYLSAHFESDSITFLPRQLLAEAKTFQIDELVNQKIQIPNVSGKDVRVNWKPYNDSMYVNTKEDPFVFFKDEDYRLIGTAILTPVGLKGRGTFDWAKGFLKSDLFSFGVNHVTFDTADLSIRALGGEDALAFDTRNINGKVDFISQRGDFKANSEQINTYMPFDQYRTSMNEFSWDMTKDIITFRSDEKKPATFLSTDPRQDSLQFRGKTAEYDLNTNYLKVGGVEFVASADALVYPPDKNILILPGGAMDTIREARIICDTVNRVHTIEQATVAIEGKRKYRATGYYAYPIGNREQNILFESVVAEPVGKGQYSAKRSETRGQGTVTENDSFYIDLKTRFQGTIGLRSSEKALSLEGYAFLEAPLMPNRNWFSVNSKGEKENLVIRYKDNKNIDGEPVRTGMFISKETGHLYPSIMSALGLRVDRPVFEASGVFRYDKLYDQFAFGDSARLLANAYTGNRLIFNNKTAAISCEGRFTLGSGLEMIRMDAAGVLSTAFSVPEESRNQYVKYADTTTFVDLFAGLSMRIPQKLLKIMVSEIKSVGIDATNLEYGGNDFYGRGISELFGASKTLSQILNNFRLRTIEIPADDNPYDLLFSKLSLKWDDELQSFYSVGDAAEVAAINKEVVNKKMKCVVECRMPANGDDRLYVYLKSPGDFFYFFGYKQGVLSITSDNPQFMTVLETMKEKELFVPISKEQTLEIEVVTPTTATVFLNRIQEAKSRVPGGN